MATIVSNICYSLDSMTFGERLEEALQALKWGPKDLEARTSVADSTISALVRRRSDKSAYKEDLIKGFPPEKISHDWLRDEVGAMTPAPQASPKEVSYFSSMQPIFAWDHPDDLPPGEFVMVPRLNVRLSAGNGHEQVELDFVKKQPQAFRADWIRSKRLQPNKLASMTATGDSMEPRIWEGDALVVDTSQTNIIDGKVYAIWYDGGERVKRLYRMPGGGLRIKSDNQSHGPIEVAPENIEQIRVLGRIVHIAGEGGL